MTHSLPLRIKSGLKVGFIGLLVLFTFSCGALRNEKNDEKDLLLCVNDFNSSFRWEDYKQASSWLAPPLQEHFWELADSLQGQMRVMDYEVRNVSLQNNGITGLVLLRYRYYYTNDPLIRSKIVHQRWSYLQNEKIWRLVQYDMASLMAQKP